MGLSSCVCTVLGCTLSCRTLPEDDAHFSANAVGAQYIGTWYNVYSLCTIKLLSAHPATEHGLANYSCWFTLIRVGFESVDEFQCYNADICLGVFCKTSLLLLCGMGVMCAYSSDRRFEQMVSTSECIDVDAAVMSTWRHMWIWVHFSIAGVAHGAKRKMEATVSPREDEDDEGW